MKRLLSRTISFSFLMLLTLPSAAQITAVGRAATFDVATWNIEWFGAPGSGPNNDALQVQNVKNIIAGSEIELWAVQEISNTSRFEELLLTLGPDWKGELATNSGSQRIGFIWDTRAVSKRNSGHILESFADDFGGRPPLKAEFEVTLADTSMIVTLINVHMKAFGDAESYQKRLNASVRVKNHIDFSSLASASVIFLGDFNDEFTASTYANQVTPYANFLQDTDNYDALTFELEQANRATWIGSFGGSNLDHIIISSELRQSYLPGSVNTMDGLRSIIGFTAQTSDHLPVYASFGSSVVLDTEDEGDAGSIPVAFLVRDLYPNPALAGSKAQVTFTSPSLGTVDVQLYNTLGRLVASDTYTLSAGTHSMPISLANLNPGAYFVRITTGSGPITSGILADTKMLFVVR